MKEYAEFLKIEEEKSDHGTWNRGYDWEAESSLPLFSSSY